VIFLLKRRLYEASNYFIIAIIILPLCISRKSFKRGCNKDLNPGEMPIEDGVYRIHTPAESGHTAWEDAAFKNGKKNGITKLYIDGNLNAEVNYRDGGIHGLLKTYYENGKLNTESNYKNGKADGVSKVYYERV